MKTSNIALIIVNWNGKNQLDSCLSSIKSATQPRNGIKIFVIDNGSHDGSVQEVRSKHKDVELITSNKNLGFSGGNNLGAKVAYDTYKPDVYWFLNNDTVINNTSINLVNSLNDHSVGAASPKIFFSKGCEFHKERYDTGDLGNVIWYAGGIIDWNNVYAYHRGVDEVDHGQYNDSMETDFVTGCSFVVRAEIFRELGGFDDRYFLYLEDVDLSIRIKQQGFKILYYPDAYIWHSNASTSGGPGSGLHEYYQTRNRLLLGMKYAKQRTKIALVKEAIGMLLTGSGIKKRSVLDYFTHNMGGSYGF